MTIDIERLKVDESLWPEGATHYFYMTDGPMFAPFFARTAEHSDFEMDDLKGGWEGEKLSGGAYHVFAHAWHSIPRPEPRQVEWDGESAPEPGELAVTSGGKCRVIGWDSERGQVAVQWYDGEMGVINVQALKPIRTKEQREREDAVAAALALDRYPNGEAAGGLMSRRDFCEKLYDCGLLRSKAQ